MATTTTGIEGEQDRRRLWFQADAQAISANDWSSGNRILIDRCAFRTWIADERSPRFIGADR
jgi:hypothetical protein